MASRICSLLSHCLFTRIPPAPTVSINPIVLSQAHNVNLNEYPSADTYSIHFASMG